MRKRKSFSLTGKNGNNQCEESGNRKPSLKKADILLNQIELTVNLIKDSSDGLQRQQTEATKRNRPSPVIVRNLGDFSRLLTLQVLLPEHLPETWDRPTEEKDRMKELLLNDPIARELIVQLQRRRLYLLNTSAVKEVE
jgi:hypothetical protein